MRRNHRKQRREKRVVLNPNRMTKHHLTPKFRGNKKSDENLLILKWANHHCAWHKLFGHLSLEEIIACLQRIASMKHRGTNASPVLREM
jgi:hypothetical protein